MQGLADGYFVIPYTLAHYLGEHAAAAGHDRRTTRSARPQAASQARIDQLLSVKGIEDAARSCTASSARMLWDEVGMARNEPGLQRALERDSAAARGVLAERLGARRRRTT